MCVLILVVFNLFVWLIDYCVAACFWVIMLFACFVYLFFDVVVLCDLIYACVNWLWMICLFTMLSFICVVGLSLTFTFV